MRADRPPPDEEPNTTGVETVPRQSASVILVRGGAETLEVLLVKRSPRARWMAGVWVFPGGAVDPEEGHRVAAVRELEEEAGVRGVQPEALVQYSRWITPAQVRTRFDTHFFLAPLPEGQEPTPDAAEVVELGWFAPAAALEAHRQGRILLVFPTIKHLEQLAAFESADALLAHSRGREVVPVQPQVVGAGETARIVLPGEPGYTP